MMLISNPCCYLCGAVHKLYFFQDPAGFYCVCVDCYEAEEGALV